MFCHCVSGSLQEHRNSLEALSAFVSDCMIRLAMITHACCAFFGDVVFMQPHRDLGRTDTVMKLIIMDQARNKQKQPSCCSGLFLLLEVARQ